MVKGLLDNEETTGAEVIMLTQLQAAHIPVQTRIRAMIHKLYILLGDTRLNSHRFYHVLPIHNLRLV